MVAFVALDQTTLVSGLITPRRHGMVLVHFRDALTKRLLAGLTEQGL
jgi:hypothetical protein